MGEITLKPEPWDKPAGADESAVQLRLVSVAERRPEHGAKSVLTGAFPVEEPPPDD